MKDGYYFIKTNVNQWIIAEYLAPYWMVTCDDDPHLTENIHEIGNFIGRTSEEIEESNKEMGVINALKPING